MKIRYLFSTLLLVACSGNDTADDDDSTIAPQCGAAEYIAFDAANHANQDIRIAAYVEIVARMRAAAEDPSTAAAEIMDLEENVYTRADLRAKVQGRQDDHFDPPMDVGADLDARIMAGFAAGRTATTAVDLTIARQAVDKTLIEFFYLSVFHEMVLGQRSKWDEAFGYYGAPSDNAEGDRKGLAAVATSRDATNNTTLSASIFNGIVDGSCALVNALTEAATDEIDVRATPALWSIIEATDEDMQKVLAFSAGHEAFDMVEVQARLPNGAQEDIDEMRIKLAELDPYFKPIERLMNDRGGMSAARAARLRSEIDAALNDSTTAWMATFDAQGIIDDLEAEYGIDVRG
ncbi:MAG: hypothetical protein RIT81_43385 [Deltaproteobacteria bacterium]